MYRHNNTKYFILLLACMASLHAVQEANLRVEITVPGEVDSELRDNQRTLANGLQPFLEPYGLTFTKINQFHITLVYIDKMPVEKYDALQAALQKAAAAMEPIKGVYIAGSPILFGAQPFIVFPLKESNVLSQAVRTITKELEAQQIPVKKFATFKPHISLGYVSIQYGRNLLNNIGMHKQVTYKGKQVKIGEDGLMPYITQVCKDIPVAADEVTADALIVTGAKPLQVSLEKKK